MTKMKKKQEILGEERRVVRETLSKRPEGMLAWLDSIILRFENDSK